jgi:hypothetical protein
MKESVRTIIFLMLHRVVLAFSSGIQNINKYLVMLVFWLQLNNSGVTSDPTGRKAQEAGKIA